MREEKLKPRVLYDVTSSSDKASTRTFVQFIVDCDNDFLTKEQHEELDNFVCDYMKHYNENKNIHTIAFIRNSEYLESFNSGEIDGEIADVPFYTYVDYIFDKERFAYKHYENGGEKKVFSFDIGCFQSYLDADTKKKLQDDTRINSEQISNKQVTNSEQLKTNSEQTTNR